MGDSVKGKMLAKRCKACHTFEEGGRHKVGPNLFMVYGRTSGSLTGFKYSDSLKNASFTWNEAHLVAWVCNSKQAIKAFTGDMHANTKMPVQRQCGQNALDITAYLKTLK